MTGPDLIVQAHALVVDLLSAEGDLVPQILAIDGEGEVVARTMLLGSATAAEAAGRALQEPGVEGVVYLGLADQGDRRALFVEAVSRWEPERHFQLFQEFRFGAEGLALGDPVGYQATSDRSHLGAVFSQETSFRERES